MKIISLKRKTLVTGPTYGDSAVIVDDDGERILCRVACSTSPNPYRPSDNAPWTAAYAQIAPGVYSGRFMVHEHYGPCVLLNNGGPVPTINANVNQAGKRFATEVFIHKGDSMKWRGSKACPTLPPMAGDVTRWSPYAEFMSWFKAGEEVKVVLEEDPIA